MQDTPEPPEWSMADQHWEDPEIAEDLDYWLGHLRQQDDLDASLPALKTYTPPPATHGDTNGTEHTTWWPVDLAELFTDGYEPQQPELLERTDGRRLLYRGKCHACNGEGESGKSWFLLIACLQVVAAGGHVLYLDFEDTAQTVVTRLLALGAQPADVLARFHYTRPTEATFTRTNSGPRYAPGYADLHATLDRYHPELVVIDGVAEAMALHALDPEKNNDFVTFHDTLTRPIARTGAACAYIDHVTKDREARGKYAIGGVHKFNVIDGAVFSFTPRTAFGVGRHGSSQINVQKDRPGQLRQHTPDGKHIADLHLISDPDTHRLTFEIRAPGDDGGQWRPPHYMEKVYDWIADRNDQGVHPVARQIEDAGLGAANHIRAARSVLVAEGYVTTSPGARNALHHLAVKPYRRALDPLDDQYQPPPEGGPDEDF